ncbi:MAG: hypothetical protein ACI9S9_002299, partial [Planctomycetota bacterium]
MAGEPNRQQPQHNDPAIPMNTFTATTRLLLLAASLSAMPALAQTTTTCGGYVMTDDNSVRVVDAQGAVSFTLATGNYPSALVSSVGPR